MKSLRRQRGLVALEVALIGMIAMVTLFAVFEVARVFFVFNTLEEATRRGARLAAVCPVNDPSGARPGGFQQLGRCQTAH
jgi:Flp pilus assembly protein TadG